MSHVVVLCIVIYLYYICSTLFLYIRQFCKVIIVSSDYGEKENADLGERFDAKRDDFPVYLLFLNGNSEPVRFKGDAKNADEIKKFLMKESGQ